VGTSAAEILADRAQMASSLALTRWLMAHFHITSVIGHAESLSSPYHREDVPSLRHQTHGDWSHGSMQIYRHKLNKMGAC